VKVEAYAKVNLTLEVFGRRSDGYHALRSVVLPVSLSDTLEIETTADGTLSSDTGYADDLCVKAAEILRSTPNPQPSTFSLQPSTFNLQPGAAIRATKRIPAGGGLGGGSADAAATLLALNELWGLKKSREELAEIGAAVGSDVPSLVLGGPVLMEGRGERVTRLDVGPVSGLSLVLVNPGVFSSTREIFAHCTPRLPSGASIVYNMRQALGSGDIQAIAAATMNDLQAPACARHPEIREALAALEAAGAAGVTMSGSGSTVFGLVRSEAEGRKIAGSLASRGFWARVVGAIDCPVV